MTVFPTTEPAAEPSTPGAFTVKRDGDLTDALVVNYNVGGTAVPGVDYVPLSGTVTIPAGATSADVAFTPMDDGVLAPDKTVTLMLTNDFNYDVGTPGSATHFHHRKRATHGEHHRAGEFRFRAGRRVWRIPDFARRRPAAI